ncbi:MAG: NAD(P)-dependent alcohol dehydrogenase [Salinarimonadaceae bacterium]|nr:MAG: NAD(P)-dependent alcohol dehydrogenase [Salinarimonadaceae bacterium]
MKLYRLTGGGIDGLVPEQADVPRPGPGQALVRMRAASLNYRDIMVIEGRYGRGKAKERLVPVSDGAGEVVETGSDVRRVKAGDRVVASFMQNWRDGPPRDDYNDSALGASIDGVLSEFVLFDAEGLVKIPDALSFEEAATLPCAGVTAWHALFHDAGLRLGQTVLTLGSGGVSVFALQLAHAAGMRVIATSSSDEKLERLRELGASELVNYRQRPDWERRVLELTDGRGVDHVVHVIRSGDLERSIQATRFGGAVHLVASAVESEAVPGLVTRRLINLRGIHVGSREMLEALARVCAQRNIRPVIDRVFPFEDAREAYRFLKSGSHFGKVVIDFP